MIKYRIIIGPSESHPYLIQTKDFTWQFWWKTVESIDSLERAERYVKALFERAIIKQQKPKKGTIIKYYEESDFIIDKLKDK